MSRSDRRAYAIMLFGAALWYFVAGPWGAAVAALCVIAAVVLLVSAHHARDDGAAPLSLLGRPHATQRMPIHAVSPKINGEVLEAYAESDQASQCNVLILLRVVLERGDPMTVTDMSLEVVMRAGETLVGQLDRGNLSDWVVVSQRRESSPLVASRYTVKSADAAPDPLLPKISAQVPLVRGVHVEGWVVFKFPPPDLASWQVDAEIQHAKSVTLTIVDALSGTHRVPITQPWNQPNMIIHRSWLPG